MSDDALAELVGGQGAPPDKARTRPALAPRPRGQRRPQGRYQRCGARHRRGRKQQAATAAAAEQQGESVVQARDGKHVIPYQVLAQERERAIRAEQMVRDLTAKLELDQAAAQQGKPRRPICPRSSTSSCSSSCARSARRCAPDGQPDRPGQEPERAGRSRPAAEQAESSRREQQYRRWCPSRTPSRPIETRPPPCHRPGCVQRPRRHRHHAARPRCLEDKPLAERFDAAVRMRSRQRRDRAARPGHQGRAARSQPIKPPALRRPWRKPGPRHRVLPRFPISRAASRPPIPRARPCWLCRAAP